MLVDRSKAVFWMNHTECSAQKREATVEVAGADRCTFPSFSLWLFYYTVPLPERKSVSYRNSYTYRIVEAAIIYSWMIIEIRFSVNNFYLKNVKVTYLNEPEIFVITALRRFWAWSAAKVTGTIGNCSLLPLHWESCLSSLATWQSIQANKSRNLRGHNTTNYDVIKNDNKSLSEYSNTVLDRRVLKYDNAWKQQTFWTYIILYS